MKNAVTLLLFILCSTIVFAQANAKDYIDKYKSVALQQMIETDVPASISLGQGIMESEVGTNILALQANNHFGMQCSNNWKGQALYKLKDGEEVCYKVYNSPAESYIEHTTALAANPQFENLFYIESTNYKRWAKGLEALKYSTLPDYANQLIQIVELYELDRIDENIDIYQDEIGTEDTDFETPYKSNEDILYINGVKAVIANGKETPLEFAARMKVPLRKVLKYNDILLSQEFYPGQYVFLDRKKSKYTENLEVHKVKETDNIYLISQKYGIRLNKLLKMNQLKTGEEPKAGEKIYLKTKTPQKPILRSSKFTPDTTPQIQKEEPVVTSPVRITKPPTTTEPTTTKPTTKPSIPNNKPITKPSIPNNKPTTTPSDDDGEGNIIYIYPDDPSYGEEEIVKEEVANNATPPVRNIPTKPTKEPNTNLPVPTNVPANVHVVQKGETLYRISKKYNISVERLKDLNGLLSNTIEINQQLRYK
ncbi:MAG: glucosaminidase domain-containing protein [Saprospiraceae bacterium]